MVQFKCHRVNKPLCLIHIEVYCSLGAPHGRARNGEMRRRSPFEPSFISLQYKEMVWEGWVNIAFIGCKWSNWNALSTETSVSHSLLSQSLFPIFTPCSSLCSIKNWFIMGGWVKRW